MINNYSRVIPIMGKYQSIVHRGLTKLTTRDGRCYDCNSTYRSSALFIWFLLRQPEMHFFLNDQFCIEVSVSEYIQGI